MALIRSRGRGDAQLLEVATQPGAELSVWSCPRSDDSPHSCLHGAGRTPRAASDRSQAARAHQLGGGVHRQALDVALGRHRRQRSALRAPRHRLGPGRGRAPAADRLRTDAAAPPSAPLPRRPSQAATSCDLSTLRKPPPRTCAFPGRRTLRRNRRASSSIASHPASREAQHSEAPAS